MEDATGGDGIAGDMPRGGKAAKISRGALQVLGGAIPFAGGALSAIAGAWSEQEQERVNRFFEHWVQMLQDELKEKAETIVEIMARLDLQDEAVASRVESREYQSLLKKSFRDWAGSESEKKRVYIRNILANAAASTISSDDVVRMYIDWIDAYSEMHFDVIAAVYNASGITRKGIWARIGRREVLETSADADLYKLLIRDLSMGGIIRQHREVDYYGQYVAKPQRAKQPSGQKTMVSAFDDVEQYELTELGQQFVHYAMSDIPTRIEFEE